MCLDAMTSGEVFTSNLCYVNNAAAYVGSRRHGKVGNYPFELYSICRVFNCTRQLRGFGRIKLWWVVVTYMHFSVGSLNTSVVENGRGTSVTPG